MHAWVNDVVRCPATLSAPNNISGNATNSSLAADHYVDPSSFLSNGFFEHTAVSFHNLMLWLNADETHAGHHYTDTSLKSNDMFPFASTTLLYLLIAFQDVIFCVFIVIKFHGFRIYTSRRQQHGSSKRSSSFGGYSPLVDEEGPSMMSRWAAKISAFFTKAPMSANGAGKQTPTAGRHASRVQPVMNSSFVAENRSLLLSPADRYGSNLGDERPEEVSLAEPLPQVRIVTRSTDNKIWALYFASLCVVRVIAGGSLIFAANVSHEDASQSEALRIATLVQRLVHGVSCVWLAVALNIQRLHRVRDHRNARANSALLRQSTWMNRFCFGVFVLFSIGDFIASHFVVSDHSDASESLYWVSTGCLALLAVPSVLSTLWVVLHEAAIQPSRGAKALLVCGVCMHLVVQFPPSLWNDHLLASWVSRDPCPASYLSFFDLLLVAHFVSTSTLFGFVVLEHRRTSAISHQSYVAFCEERLNQANNRRGRPSRLQQEQGGQVRQRPIDSGITERSMSTVRDADVEGRVALALNNDDDGTQGEGDGDEQTSFEAFVRQDRNDDEIGHIGVY